MVSGLESMVRLPLKMVPYGATVDSGLESMVRLPLKMVPYGATVDSGLESIVPLPLKMMPYGAPCDSGLESIVKLQNIEFARRTAMSYMHLRLGGGRNGGKQPIKTSTLCAPSIPAN